jgi:phosphatidate cytidylyltransferase
MLRTRLLMGSVLIALAVGVLAVDQYLAPWYPFLFVLVLAASCLACAELLSLLGSERGPSPWFCYPAVIALVVANWLAHVPLKTIRISADPWDWILGTFICIVLGVFLVEMASFEKPGESVPRMGLTLWLVAYVGLLPSFLTQIRWMHDVKHGSLALALAIFVPKMCDTGAYFTGRLLGRHPMAPILSPKKTWEGAAGGLTLAVLTAIAIDRLVSRLVLDSVSPRVFVDIVSAIGFGVIVGIVSMLGDLAESLIKRDVQQKDASHVMPGFGGVLDVVDSIIFAAPVAYYWLAARG